MKLSAVVGTDGIITAVDVLDGGGNHFDASCPPTLVITNGSNVSLVDSAGIKPATFTVAIDALGQIDSVAITFAGHGYPGQNYPSTKQSAWVGGEIVELDKAVISMPNMDRHVDFHLGTGASTSNDKTSGE